MTPNASAVPIGSSASRLGFGPRFALLCLLLFVLIHSLPLDWMRPIGEHTAWALSGSLRMVGVHAVRHGELVVGGGFGVSIIPACTALLPGVLFLCFVLGHPSSVSEKAFGLLVGMPALYVGNLIRLLVTFLAGLANRELFDAFHIYLGQVFTLGCVVFVCRTWTKYLDGPQVSTFVQRMDIMSFVRFLAISVPAFLFWHETNRAYMWLVDQCATLGFSGLGLQLIIRREVDGFFYTFNTVSFVTLVCVARNVQLGRKLKGILLGIILLFVLHVACRLGAGMVVGLRFLSLGPFVEMLLAIAQYVVPLVLWLSIIKGSRWPDAFGKEMESRSVVSPGAATLMVLSFCMLW